MILGAVLPRTGSTKSLMIWMMGLFLWAMGKYFRLKAGRSPGYVEVITV